MKTPSEEPIGRPTAAIDDAFKRRLIHWWRCAADFINAGIARIPVSWLRVALLLLSAMFGAYCLDLLTGFL